MPESSNKAPRVVATLPVERPGALSRMWVGLQLRGLLAQARATPEPVMLDMHRIRGATTGDPILQVSLSTSKASAGGLSLSGWQQALIRAVGELIESLAWMAHEPALGETRSGWAAGETPEAACRSAYAELVERDSLLAHVLCPDLRSTPLPPPAECALGAQYTRLWSADRELAVVLGGLRDAETGVWFLGSGAATTDEIARGKAFLEVATVYNGFCGAVRATRRDGPARHELIVDHLRSSADPRVTGAIERTLGGTGTIEPAFAARSDECTFSDPRNFGPSFAVCRATHPKLCPLTFGAPWEASRTEVSGLLEARGLTPEWLKHPFA